eukprot:TRINITY_DN10028_c0_g1_i4.p1 TRINITY_DN10028_c0_g1~~TRINITY_DN10028_c0_g1_i4.p1  ORF type:complete len:103 (-),score=6.16 TRINITY_DN10028_c0_g1_i4:140-448(-)
MSASSTSPSSTRSWVDTLPIGIVSLLADSLQVVQGAVGEAEVLIEVWKPRHPEYPVRLNDACRQAVVALVLLVQPQLQPDLAPAASDLSYLPVKSHTHVVLT